jgi:hypothetical protein
MTDHNPTHCIDCLNAIYIDGDFFCASPAVLTLSDEQRAQYDDPEQACPVFEGKVVLIEVRAI